jgi:pSer/pThr/pTyr-binding forkhead associated (FHA) protein
MSFLIIEHERYALQIGETVLGGTGDELLGLSALGRVPPFAVITSGVDSVATIRALPGGAPAYLGEHALTDRPTALRHGDRLVVDGLSVLYGDVSALGRTSPVEGVSVDDTDLLAQWSWTEGTAPTGGRLVAAGGEVRKIPDAGLVIGRDPECGLVVNSTAVSRRHATIAPGLLGYTVSDESTNGVLVNGVRIERTALLRQGDLLRIGHADFRFEADPAAFDGTHLAAAEEPSTPAAAPALPSASAAALLATLEVLTRGVDEGRRFRIERPLVQLGRAAHNEVRIADDSVSASHATLLWRGTGWTLLDLGSRNGSYVDGERIIEHQVSSGCEIRVGNVKLLFRAIERVSADQATRGIVGLTDEQLRRPTR